MTNSSVGDRIAAITQKLPSTVKLVAVSKYASVAAIREAYGAGIRDFGESRVQDTIIKQQQLLDLPDMVWHMIGRLQSNKSRLALAHFDWIHACDRLSLAQQLDKLVQETGNQAQICLQVKLADDPSKSGWYEQELMADLASLKQCQNLKIVGLMTILPLGLNSDQAYTLFSKLANLKQDLRSQGWENLEHLSMGMSQDYDQAIRAGATMIRLGTSIFG